MVERISLSYAKQIYNKYLKKHFPDGEVKPFANIERMWSENCYRAYGYFEGDELLGYAFICSAKEGEVFLLDYLAVLEGHRDKGHGSAFLQELAECLANDGEEGIKEGLIIETEVCEHATSEEEKLQRIMRDSFYRKNGVLKSAVLGQVYTVEYRVWMMPLLSDGSKYSSRIIVDEKFLNGYCLQKYDELYRYMLSEKGYAENFKVIIEEGE